MRVALSQHPTATDSYRICCLWFWSLGMWAVYSLAFARIYGRLKGTRSLTGLRIVDWSCRGSISYLLHFASWSLAAQCLLSLA
jgi:hypothetical protein